MARKARADSPSVPYCIRLSDAERERVESAARICSQKPSDFARDALVTAAEECLETVDSWKTLQ